MSVFEPWIPECLILKIDPIFYHLKSPVRIVVFFESRKKNIIEDHALVLSSEWLHPF